MSKSDVDQDGFKIVKSKRNSKNKQTKAPKNLQFVRQNSFVDVDIVFGRILAGVEDLKASEYFKKICEAVSTVLEAKSLVEVVCFGLGRISDCQISRYQLAFLLCVKDYLSPSKVFVHDPIFTKSECDILKRLGLEVIEENCEGNYTISDTSVTLAYFPHCPKQLTNNFLWCNWGVKLHNCLLICNSFTTLIDNNPNRIISESVPFIYKIHPHTKETAIQNNFKFTDIFNDTALHHFPVENLSKIDSDFWHKGSKPAYKNTEEFITSLMIEKLTI